MVAPKDGPSAAPRTGFEPGETNTELQAHVAFFDRDGDGIIWPSDTYVGFRRVNFGIVLAILAVFIVHGGFSYVTWGSWIPDPFFRLRVNRMHRGKHGSDSQAFTSKGEFDENRFDYVFNMYSEEPHTHLTFWQGVRMVHGNMNPFDPFGWFAAIFEWGATYLMIWPNDHRGIHKDDVKGVFDGSLFHKIAEGSKKQEQ